MERIAEKYLADWKEKDSRKPLILRGARQVGKSYLVENWGKQNYQNVLTINFEKTSEYNELFSSFNPQKIIQEIGIVENIPITPGETLIFLDEIQNCPIAIKCLRYFYEESPEYHVIAAGSLLDFTLRKFEHSMPVGRVEFLYLQALNFKEFVRNTGGSSLIQYTENYNFNDTFSEPIHNKLLEYLRQYYFVGGMPGVVKHFAKNTDYQEVHQLQSEILQSLELDFYKYETRLEPEILRKSFQYIAKNAGQKIKYVNISRDHNSTSISKGLELLNYARVIHKAPHSSGNGIPLGAEENTKHFKAFLFDIGLSNHLSGLTLERNTNSLLTINKGTQAEQFAAQELISKSPIYTDRSLHYWHRESKNSNAEVDFLWPYKNTILPIEIKANKSGSLRSLHRFCNEKNTKIALRFDTNTPSIQNINIEVDGKPVQFKLISLPLYLINNFESLLERVC